MIIACELCKCKYDIEDHDSCPECGFDNEDLISGMEDDD